MANLFQPHVVFNNGASRVGSTEVLVGAFKFIPYYLLSSLNPFFVPLGSLEIAELMAWM